MRRGNLLKLLALIVIVAVIAALSFNPLSNPDPKKGIPLGLDIRGGVNLVLQAEPGPGQTQITKDDMDVAKTTLEKRVNSIGVSEPIIQIDYDKKRLLLDLAGLKDIEEARRLVSTTAQLTFRDPNDETKVVLNGSDLKDARAGQDSKGQYVVDISFNPEGAKIFADLTTKNVGKRMAIYLDNTMQTDPNIIQPITNGQAQISGGYKTLADAAQVANLLRSGALPVSLKIVQERSVGALFGADSLMKSLNAAKWGVVYIFIFMVLYYRIPGLVANFSLIVYALLVLWILWAFRSVLTLPGMAGFVLSIGMAVDFNIIIFERLKEELRLGKSLKAAIESGFNRAFVTVIDAHVTTSIAAITLIFFGSGPIKGFAVTLLIGIVSSLFTAITFTRYVLRIAAGLKGEQNLKLYGA